MNEVAIKSKQKYEDKIEV